MHVETLWGYWVGIVERMNGPLPRQVTELEECQEALELVVGVTPFLDEAKAAVKSLRGISEPAWHDDEAVGGLIADLEATAARDALVEFDAQLSPVVHTLACAEIRPNAHPVNVALTKAILNRDTKAYSDAWNELCQLIEDRQRLENREAIFQAIERHAPRLAAMLAGDSANPAWDDRLGRIEQAWNWSRANAWLHEFHCDQDADKLEAEAKSLQKDIQHSMAGLAAEKAWRHCFDRLTEAQRQHLMAWTTAVRRIGKGTGKNAEKHRRNAREHMDECRGAVPAWIMPFYRLAETVDAKPESFDVVIVDEASQSGPDTLALLYLAKQIIVVGDDQQISPEVGFVDHAAVDLLSERLIPDLPMRDALGVGSSLFNQAVIRFGRRIVLREHFRCVPEIIRFSNDLCYTATPLVPLRQYSPERLDPIVVRHVLEGFREGGAGYARNKPEAEALVAAIVQCTKDPRYLCTKDDHHPNSKLTFGVISLQGEEQAKLINQLLLERLTPEEMEQRELVCGDAYAFQGDERDVMFLSMVAAPNQRIGALTKTADMQRFNVSASRARDQVWLFHTATLNDLTPGCMRHLLLAYYSNPATQPVGKPDWEKCDSDFEREVGRIIYEKNFRLIPQYEPFAPGSYRIDFVIEGLKSRLAVECDGPHHDDPEQIERDMARQRQLERCKWVFWRVSASSFYFDRDKAMASLWRKLEELGIHPLTPTSATASSETPQHIERTGSLLEATPPASQVVPRNLSEAHWPSRQPDLIPSNQMELPTQKAETQLSRADVNHEMAVPPALRAYVSAARQKRPYGVLVREEIGHVVLELLPHQRKIDRKELIRNAADVLDFSEAAFKRIDEALRRLEDLKKVCADSNFVWRRRP
jgi:very-short-patch-repair endonuclease